MKDPLSASGVLYSIGEVSALTGLSTHTVRVWERRYGRPIAVRLASGHRRYTESELIWLRAMAELISYGNRPGRLMKTSDEELYELLERERRRIAPNRESLGELIDDVVANGVEAVQSSLSEAAREMGVRRALHEFVGPLVQLVGQKWSEGDLTIRHEHMITELVHDALRAARLELPDRPMQPGGPHLILSTLPDERHGLGLEMVHLLAQLAGAEVRLLGVDLPVSEIAKAGKEHPEATIAISVSVNANGAEVDRALTELVARLPDDQSLIVGGQGVRMLRRRIPGVTLLDGLGGFEEWLQSRFGPDCFD